MNIVKSDSVILISTKNADIGSWDSQMWESWDTMGELGYGHGTWVMAQLSHIGRVGPLCGRVGPYHDTWFYP